MSRVLGFLLLGTTAWPGLLLAQAPDLPPPNAVAGSVLQDENPFVRPTLDELFRADSETSFKERLRRSAAAKNLKTPFPVESEPATGPIVEREQAPLQASYVPTFVCYQPLYFEDKNTERYGWYVPCAQPFLSTARFYLKTALLPVSLARQHPWSLECNTGYPLPGDPVPWRCRLFE